MATQSSTPRIAIRAEPVAVRTGVPTHGWSLVAGLAACVLTSAVVMWSVPGVLTGPAVMNGNARGTVLVMASLALPLLLVSALAAARSLAWAPFLWLGSSAYLVYNGFMLLMATPFNSLFLVYVAGFALSIGVAATMLRDLDAEAVAARVRPGLPVRGLAVFVWAVVALNTLAWLGRIAPAVLSDRPTQILEGSGLTTNPIYVQDLAVWLPLMAVAAWWLWQGRAWGVVLVGAGATFWTLENIGVAVDQVVGYRADPTTSWASQEAAVVFLAFAVVTASAAAVFFRAARRDDPQRRRR